MTKWCRAFAIPARREVLPSKSSSFAHTQIYFMPATYIQLTWPSHRARSRRQCPPHRKKFQKIKLPHPHVHLKLKRRNEPISEPENQHLPRFDVFSSIFRVCFRVRYVIRRGERIENGEEDVLDTVPEPLSNVPGEWRNLEDKFLGKSIRKEELEVESIFCNVQWLIAFEI